MPVVFNGERAQSLRKAKGYRLAELAESADMTERYLSDLEHGKKRNPSASYLYRICRALGVSMESLMQEFPDGSERSLITIYKEVGFKMPEIFPKVCEMLFSLGASPNYIGFYPTAYAIALCAGQQEMLLLVTKRLYPEVARYYNTNWKAVERNIRTVIAVIWERNPTLLSSFAHRQLQYKPSNTEFLAILSRNFHSDTAPDPDHSPVTASV